MFWYLLNFHTIGDTEYQFSEDHVDAVLSYDTCSMQKINDKDVNLHITYWRICTMALQHKRTCKRENNGHKAPTVNNTINVHNIIMKKLQAKLFSSNTCYIKYDNVEQQGTNAKAGNKTTDQETYVYAIAHLKKCCIQ